MRNYISVSIVSETLLLIDAIQKHGYYQFSDIHQLRLPYGVRIDTALSFAKQCAWLADNETAFIFTETGKDIAQRFDGESIDINLWRLILRNYINVCEPAWARRIPSGRKEALLFMSEDEKRCFYEAQLIDNYDEETISWWDSFAALARLKSNEEKGDTGRRGERLTVDYEKKRTGNNPDWCAIESNLSGYDVISQESSGNPSKILIEVKASTRSLDYAEAIISRHEWDVAAMKNNANRYKFYLWLLSAASQSLAIVSVAEMSNVIPEDRMPGHWESVAIPFTAFSEKFQTIHYD